jgi:hypothetical protein
MALAIFGEIPKRVNGAKRRGVQRSGSARGRDGGSAAANESTRVAFAPQTHEPSPSDHRWQFAGQLGRSAGATITEGATRPDRIAFGTSNL